MTKLPIFNEVNEYRTQNHHYVLSIRFFMRHTHADVASSILYVRTTINGKRAPEKSLNIKLLKSDWDHTTQTVKSTGVESQKYNTRLNQVKAKLYEAFLILQQTDSQITARKVQDKGFGQKATYNTFKDAFDRFIIEKEITSTLHPRTVQAYKKYHRNISTFLVKNGSKNIVLQDISEKTMLDMLSWFKKAYSHDYAIKNVQFFRSIFTYAFSKGMVDRNPLTSIRLEKAGNYDTTHLSQVQVKKIAEFNFNKLDLPEETIKVLSEERDALIFTCYTGLHHSDYRSALFELKQYNGRTWLTGFRIKSKGGKKDKPYSIPLHPLALAVIDKYGSLDRLPKRSNVKRNVILKKIATHTEVKVHLTTKIARKTLADYCLNTLKMRQEVVASVLGHTSTKFIKHYAAISNLSIDEEMQFEV